MEKYTVRMEQQCTVDKMAYAEVEASSEEEAREIAFALAKSGKIDFSRDGHEGETYDSRIDESMYPSWDCELVEGEK